MKLYLKVVSALVVVAALVIGTVFLVRHIRKKRRAGAYDYPANKKTHGKPALRWYKKQKTRTPSKTRAPSTRAPVKTRAPTTRAPATSTPTSLPSPMPFTTEYAPFALP